MPSGKRKVCEWNRPKAEVGFRGGNDSALLDSTFPLTCVRGYAPPPHSHHDHEQAATPSAGANCFCPMCLGVESDKPGACPKCGMSPSSGLLRRGRLHNALL